MSKRLTKEKGTVLIITSLVLATLLILGGYFLTFVITESRISRSQMTATQTYYLAEAGINEAIWKLKNDDEWSTCFISESLTYDCDCENWSASFVRDIGELAENSFLEISIQNLSCGRGQVVATSTTGFGQNFSQRVVKAIAFKAAGVFTEDAFLGDGNVDISQTAINIYDGNLTVEGNIAFRRNSSVNIYNNAESEQQEGQVLAGGNIDVSVSSLTASSTCSKNMCTELCEGYVPGLTSCPPEEIVILAVDFDSDDPGSYLSKAQAAEAAGLCLALCNGQECSSKCVFNESEFDDLLLQVGGGGTLTLLHNKSGSLFSIYYIDGNLELRGERNLIINGALVVSGNTVIGDRRSWGGGSGNSQVTVNNPGLGVPSGILVKGNIKFGKYASSATVTIEGLIYALGNFNLTSAPHLIEIMGGKIVAGNFELTSLAEGINIYLDNDIIVEGIFGGPANGGPADSPVINVEHWEETY